MPKSEAELAIVDNCQAAAAKAGLSVEVLLAFTNQVHLKLQEGEQIDIPTAWLKACADWDIDVAPKVEKAPLARKKAKGKVKITR